MQKTYEERETESASTVRKSTNIRWHDERQNLLNLNGCVVRITDLSGSGISTLTCVLSRELHIRGHRTYVLDSSNLRHGLNRDLSFKAEDHAENISRGKVAKLFADAVLISIAIEALVAVYSQSHRLFEWLSALATQSKSSFIDVSLNTPLEVCEARDPKGLYKLARTGKIIGYTGIDDPYEPPSDREIVIQCEVGECPPPKSLADRLQD